MRIDFRGKLVEGAEVRAGFVGCGGHAFRNLLPVFQFAPVRLVATCDLSLEKAQAFAAKFGATAAYSDYREMTSREHLDCAFICVGPDQMGQRTGIWSLTALSGVASLLRPVVVKGRWNT